jgi:hypothetical protein
MSARRLEALGGLLLLAVGVTALALAFSGPGSASAQPLTASASGAMRIASSSANQAILSAANMWPGGSVRGTTEIRNGGKASAALALAPQNLGDAAGAGGGVLSSALQLTVRDVTGGSDAIVFSGRFGSLGRIRVGALAPGERRRYSFTAVLPDTGSAEAQDAFAGARTSVDYRWSLTGQAFARCATRLSGEGRANRLIGTVGGDRIAGGAGADRIDGRGGDDCLAGGPGRDSLNGGSGDDSIQARDGAADRLDCGAGEDVATVDPKDTTRGCETLR